MRLQRLTYKNLISENYLPGKEELHPSQACIEGLSTLKATADQMIQTIRSEKAEANMDCTYHHPPKIYPLVENFLRTINTEWNRK